MAAEGSIQRPRILGIVNLTPDSFSDGGLFEDPERALDHALRLLEEGADLLDIGGESTRPGALPVEAREELRRVLPLIESLRGKCAAPLSIDTRKPEVARLALEAGCTIVNDVGGLREPRMSEIVAEAGATVIVMHMRGEPSTMQHSPVYADLLGEIRGFFERALRDAGAAGVSAEKVWLDPGLGFGKTFEHNLRILRELRSLLSLGRPLVVGASRKKFLGPLAARVEHGPAAEPSERRIPSVVAALEAARRGASVLRVHDVAETRQALRTWAAIEEGAYP